MTQTETTKRTNPLDATMTKTQVVRRKFKSGLPRTIPNRVLSKMEALARTMELFDRLRSEMNAAGLDENNAYAGLVYCQPETEDLKRFLANVIALPKPEAVATFCNDVMNLDKPLFLGILFAQHDPDAEGGKYKNVFFVWPFMLGPEAEGRLLAARNQEALGGFKNLPN